MGWEELEDARYCLIITNKKDSVITKEEKKSSQKLQWIIKETFDFLFLNVEKLTFSLPKATYCGNWLQSCIICGIIFTVHEVLLLRSN